MRNGAVPRLAGTGAALAEPEPRSPRRPRVTALVGICPELLRARFRCVVERGEV
jgi:hypothetical protein